VSAAPWGSASILLISWTYIRLMGADGLKRATEVAILNANYIARRLEPHYPVVYKGGRGRVAHECIVDARQLKKLAGIEVDDVAKRLMDYGFHARRCRFRSRHADDRADRERIEGRAGSLLRRDDRDPRGDRRDRGGQDAAREQPAQERAPHGGALLAGEWPTPTRASAAAFPLPYVRAAKYWPPVGRLNNVLGDRKLFCTCPDVSEYA
jgi:glycine dehydrogenase